MWECAGFRDDGWLARSPATTFYLVVSLAVEWAGIDTNIDTGDNLANGILLVAFVLACVAWCGVVLHALNVKGERLLRHRTSRN